LTPNVVTHFIEHREEIRDLLQRHGWFSAQRRLYKAHYRKVAAYTSVVTAPVAGPADILAKLRARNRSCGKPDFDDVEAGNASEEDALLVTIRRDLEALSGPPVVTARDFLGGLAVLAIGGLSCSRSTA
jgi:hypothetical protein